jgi:hypothetical protein
MTYTVKRLDAFSDWLKGLKDSLTRQRLNKRAEGAIGNDQARQLPISHDTTSISCGGTNMLCLPSGEL